MDSIISKNRRWRIELCGGVQPECGEGGEHPPSSIEFGVAKTSPPDFFTVSKPIKAILTALESAWRVS